MFSLRCNITAVTIASSRVATQIIQARIMTNHHFILTFFVQDPDSFPSIYHIVKLLLSFIYSTVNFLISLFVQPSISCKKLQYEETHQIWKIHSIQILTLLLRILTLVQILSELYNTITRKKCYSPSNAQNYYRCLSNIFLTY